MITKECLKARYCCFYVSDFHLEMILLPYIKNNIEKNKIIIMTEDNLRDSIQILMEKINFNNEQKKRILNLNWNGENINLEEQINKLGDNIIIINGCENYIKDNNSIIKSLNLKNINVVDCYDVSKLNTSIFKIQEMYDGVLNTKNVQ